jgi:acetyl-CoA C-acetyltransferase
VELALVAGAEALHTRRRARAAGISLDWSGGGEPTPVDPEPPPSSAIEVRHGLGLPVSIYPLYENALRVHHGRDAETHRRMVGAMLSRFAATAARNPYAWFCRERSPDEITRPAPDNRMVAYPYTKYMNSILTVNQSAAVLITSAGRARALGVPDDRMVYWLGGGDTIESPWTFTEREDFHTSNGMARAFASALAEAQLEVADVDAFDLYSCFPSSVEMACDTLGLSLDDPRPLTVTGGLPYAGGPGNNYSSHAIAAMVERIRADRAQVGMVTGVGWYFSKHSAGLYGAAPRVARPAATLADLPESPARAVPVADSASGRARVETYTVLHDREGKPEKGIVIGRLEGDARRFVAFVDGDAEALASFEESEAAGRTGRVRPEGDVNRFAPD